MQDTLHLLDQSLAGQTGQAWLSALEDIADAAGYFQPLSAKHNAAFIDAGKTLLVTFESLQSIQSMNGEAHPIGFEMVREEGWSLLSFFCDGQTWFRDPAIYRYLDRLVDDGFFEDFDQVIFYGAGSSGYAACAFSVAAPGAQVLALSPQATLDPRVSEWDDRFRRMRRISFTDRYGYAPDMLDAAVNSAGLTQKLDAVLSVEDVGVFKPHDKVYDLVGARFACAPEDVLFVSSNGWDAAGAAGYGFTTAWVNRAGDPVDRLYARPHHILNDLTTIPELR